jgi:hypothetical protein
MKLLIHFFLVCSCCIAASQKTPADFGFKELTYFYKNTTVKVIVSSKKGEENQKKPLMLYCQGSLPQPVLKYDSRGLYGVFPFDSIFQDKYHVAVMGKPGVPIIADAKDLGTNMGWYPDGKVTDEYRKYNNLDYYTGRNNYILKLLLKEPWVEHDGIVLVSHSEGTYVATKMAANKKVAALILSSGNPYGRILSILAQDRYTGNDEHTLDYWKATVENSSDDATNGQADSYKTTFSFSQPVAEDLLKLKIPILYCYGTKDRSAPYNDLFRTEAIRLQKNNITFLAYRNLEHNYFPVDGNMKPDYNTYNWPKIAADWYTWLESL